MLTIDGKWSAVGAVRVGTAPRRCSIRATT